MGHTPLSSQIDVGKMLWITYCSIMFWLLQQASDVAHRRTAFSSIMRDRLANGSARDETIN